jgi:hypothetical protein
VASADPYNWATEIFDTSSGVTVETKELDKAELGVPFNGFVEFSRDLQPKRLSYSDTGPRHMIVRRHWAGSNTASITVPSGGLRQCSESPMKMLNGVAWRLPGVLRQSVIRI